MGRVLGFSIAMATVMSATIAVYALLIAASQKPGERDALKRLTDRHYFICYGAYAVLPIALFYHYCT